ncbi:MAG TPA: nuclear transport factor 2 family protein [Terriglobia bacterium]|nr:nuclear transport factor 2 family protein [Terriglobia bacterium]
MMRRILLLPLLIAASVGIAQGQGTGGASSVDKVKQEVLKLENERNDAVLHADIAFLKRVYAPDLVYVNGFGETLTEAQHLAGLSSGTFKIIKLRHDHVRVHVYGDSVGIVTGHTTSLVKYTNGKTVATPGVYTDVWVKMNGQWRFAVHHETYVTK